METLGYLLAAVSFVWLWDKKLWDKIRCRTTLCGVLYRSDRFRKLDETIVGELLNCGTCLAGWIGIILFTCGFSVFFLSLPLLYKVITRIIEL